jgi:hypothetical protein
MVSYRKRSMLDNPQVLRTLSILRECTSFQRPCTSLSKQMKQGTFIHQVKYMKYLMKKFNMDELKPVLTPMSTTTSQDPDENGEAVD